MGLDETEEHDDMDQDNYYVDNQEDELRGKEVRQNGFTTK